MLSQGEVGAKEGVWRRRKRKRKEGLPPLWDPNLRVFWQQTREGGIEEEEEEEEDADRTLLLLQTFFSLISPRGKETNGKERKCMCKKQIYSPNCLHSYITPGV